MLHVIVSRKSPSTILVFQGFSDKIMAEKYITKNFSNNDVIAVPLPVMHFYTDPQLEKVEGAKSDETWQRD